MKPPTSLLSELTEKAAPKPQAKVTVSIESEPDHDALGEALRSALKGSDNKALCDAVAAIVTCCGDAYDEDEMSDDD